MKKQRGKEMAASKIPFRKVCEWCGQEFYAKKVTTRYCCKKCNEHAYKATIRKQVIKTVEDQFIERTVERPIREINERQYMDVADVALLIGISIRATYDLIKSGKLKASRLSSRMTIVRKADIESMLSVDHYTKIQKKIVKDITEFYTVKEIKDKYNVCESWIYKVGREKHIPRIFKMGKTYWSKEHVDKYILKTKVDDSITEWYSVPELMEKFNMTITAVYCFARSHQIPKKKHKREVFYSKKHVDIAKGLIEPEKPQYYTMKEAMAKFNMTRDQLYHYSKVFNVPKLKEGKYVKFSKKELDEALEPPKI